MPQKITVGISTGDANGIGYEVIIKALSDARINELCVPVVYGCSRTFHFYCKNIPETEQISLNIITSIDGIHSRRLNLINCVPDSLAVDPGQPTADAAKAAIVSLKTAVADLKAGKIDALVTGPINKHTVNSPEFPFTGHTDYLVNEFGATDGLMFLCSGSLRVGVATNHIQLSKVSENITVEHIISKLTVMNNSLKRDFGIDKPKIAVFGLNPHAGDNGLIGDEEENVITPAIKQARKNGILAYGPYSADGFFGAEMEKNFDAILAMYHDQGLVPFKALSFDTGINFTAGLPIVRTSPDHGTAYDIAGKGKANPQSMLSAIYAAVDIVNNRHSYDQITANPLETTQFDSNKADHSFERIFEKNFDKSFKSKDNEDQ
ncbi:MAG: 4-hydroxythreonine-4-phosphate dehydrogenase PdxA [Bacteroidales bacterium]|jgi:4-hydroxythreonine-4-phosphate dehydrogenase|nr:4-hydroxythreonine-4-phosphate dehydrogenase PdxA [Bacteroidales bacterium]MCI2121810.1 4-hydroxythreonine-4-phosphate dehydrogenase PdxA [Bacteroidales bacterium]MCI2144664.1 4-hydroxythreonine-4-phosphate dehydrogenase PdxA [Bacteroidales bacterium]